MPQIGILTVSTVTVGPIATFAPSAAPATTNR